MNTSFHARLRGGGGAPGRCRRSPSAARSADDVSVVALGCDADTRFRVASITKPFTAMLALRAARPRTTPTGVWPADVRVRHCSPTRPASTASCRAANCARSATATVRCQRASRSCPAVRRFVGRRARSGRTRTPATGSRATSRRCVRGRRTRTRWPSASCAVRPRGDVVRRARPRRHRAGCATPGRTPARGGRRAGSSRPPRICCASAGGCSREPSFAQMRTATASRSAASTASASSASASAESRSGATPARTAASRARCSSCRTRRGLRRPDELGDRCEGAVRGRERVLRTGARRAPPRAAVRRAARGAARAYAGTLREQRHDGRGRALAPGGLVRRRSAGDEAFLRPLDERRFEVPTARTCASASTSRATASRGSAAGSPRASRDRRRRRGRPSGHRRGRRRDPRRRRLGRRRGGRGVPGLVCRRDGDDRAPRRRPRDLLRRGVGRGAPPRLLRRRPVGRGRDRWRS